MHYARTCAGAGQGMNLGCSQLEKPHSRTLARGSRIANHSKWYTCKVPAAVVAGTISFDALHNPGHTSCSSGKLQVLESKDEPVLDYNSLPHAQRVIEPVLLLHNHVHLEPTEPAHPEPLRQVPSHQSFGEMQSIQQGHSCCSQDVTHHSTHTPIMGSLHSLAA